MAHRVPTALMTAFYGIILCYALCMLAIFPKSTIDDAFITFRYAENLALHSQLTWNVSEPPIEGYTGVFLPMVLALFIRAGISPVLASHAIGICAFLV